MHAPTPADDTETFRGISKLLLDLLPSSVSCADMSLSWDEDTNLLTETLQRAGGFRQSLVGALEVLRCPAHVNSEVWQQAVEQEVVWLGSTPLQVRLRDSYPPKGPRRICASHCNERKVAG
jgi:hypothetical protein